MQQSVVLPDQHQSFSHIVTVCEKILGGNTIASVLRNKDLKNNFSHFLDLMTLAWLMYTGKSISNKLFFDLQKNQGKLHEHFITRFDSFEESTKSAVLICETFETKIALGLSSYGEHLFLSLLQGTINNTYCIFSLKDMSMIIHGIKKYARSLGQTKIHILANEEDETEYQNMLHLGFERTASKGNFHLLTSEV